MFIFMLISYKNNNITSDKDWQNLPKRGGGGLLKISRKDSRPAKDTLPQKKILM